MKCLSRHVHTFSALRDYPRVWHCAVNVCWRARVQCTHNTHLSFAAIGPRVRTNALSKNATTLHPMLRPSNNCALSMASFQVMAAWLVLVCSRGGGSVAQGWLSWKHPAAHSNEIGDGVSCRQASCVRVVHAR